MTTTDFLNPIPLLGDFGDFTSLLQVANATNATTSAAVNPLFVIVRSVPFTVCFMGLLASIIAFSITLIIEKWGASVGGILGSIPTAIVPSTLGFALDALVKYNRNVNELGMDPEEQYMIRQHSMVRGFYSVPIGTFITAVFLLCWKILPNLIERLFVKLVGNTHDLEDEGYSSDSSTTSVELVEDDDRSVIMEDVTALPVNPKENLIEQVKETQSIRSRIVQYLLQPGSNKRKVIKAVIVSTGGLTVWFFMASIFLAFMQLVNPSDQVLIGVSAFFFACNVILAVVTCWKFDEKKESAQKKKTKWYIIVLRIVLPFCLVSISVLLNAFKLSLLAGLFASFPTIYLTSLFTLWIGQEEALAINSVGPMLLGSCSVSVYTMIACPTMLIWNLVAGALFAYGMAVVLINLPSFFYIKWRKSVALKNLSAQGKSSVLETDMATLEQIPGVKTISDQKVFTAVSLSCGGEYTHDDLELNKEAHHAAPLRLDGYIGLRTSASVESFESCSSESSSTGIMRHYERLKVCSSSDSLVSMASTESEDSDSSPP